MCAYVMMMLHHHLVTLFFEVQLVTEQRATGQLTALVAPEIPLTPVRYAEVLCHVHTQQLRKLQKEHDLLLLDELVLQQKRTSGTQVHSSTGAKRTLDKQIRSVRRSRHGTIASMSEHVEFLKSVTGTDPVPDNWKELAKSGNPFWATVERSVSPDRPSRHEVDAIVESYMKRQRAREQLTNIVPREIRDLLEFYSLLWLQLGACMDALERDELFLDGDSEGAQLRGLFVHAKDLSVTVGTAWQLCVTAWDNMLQLVNDSLVLKEVTEVDSREGGQPVRFSGCFSRPYISTDLYPPATHLVRLSGQMAPPSLPGLQSPHE